MKTPIQEVIDFVNDINDNDRSGFDYYYQSIMNKLNELLEKEKQQIINAAANHCYPTEGEALMYAEQYYNQTYNQNK
jgi:hypothetical protein